MSEHWLVAGASGLVGNACLRRLSGRPGAKVTALSRRPPFATFGAGHLSLDLTDPAAIEAAGAALSDVTHVIYAALHEEAELVSGWTRKGHVDTNTAMLRNLLDGLARHAPGLAHVTLFQGPKAYGVHVGPLPILAREDVHERRDIPNFYWDQEDLVRQAGKAAGWDFTILRPVFVLGQAIGGAMNWLAAIGVYAALARARGEPLSFPGDPQLLKQATDTDLLAAAAEWAAGSPAAAGQAFNVANGEVFRFGDVWPGIARAFGMEPGEPRRQSLAETLPGQAPAWDAIRQAQGLAAPGLDAFVGSSAQLADFSMGYGTQAIRSPVILSEVKIRQAGFTEVLDSDTMFAKWIARYQKAGLLPAPDQTPR
ncbi:NAD-dependent epimerase/dehydratase family protein [Nitratireductor alexandrii]|uniref:NAD-dependent epimerase/dehydratase family protein n=1 Tax=Nitratireductor alexandrii TaxID=2448161 RepID=UPI000FDB27CC|nr:NAD-dependent epimerase/dehydratase family protein [Nitratireductor alexandrii]